MSRCPTRCQRESAKEHTPRISEKKSTRLYENRQNRRDARQRESVQKREVILDERCYDRGHPHAQPMLHVSAALAGVNPAVPPVSSAVTSTSIPRFSVAQWKVATIAMTRQPMTCMLKCSGPKPRETVSRKDSCCCASLVNGTVSLKRGWRSESQRRNYYVA